MNIIQSLFIIIASVWLFLIAPSLEATPSRIYITQILGAKETFVFQFTLKVNENAEYLDGTKYKEKQFNAFCHTKDTVRFCGKVSKISDIQLLIENYPYDKREVSDIFSGDQQSSKSVFLVLSELEPFKDALSPSEFFRIQKSKDLLAIIATPVQVGFLQTLKKEQTSD